MISRSCSVALALAIVLLTASHALATGEKYHPETVGDTWAYDEVIPPGMSIWPKPATVNVVDQQAMGPWRTMSVFLGQQRSVSFSGSTLWVWDVPQNAAIPVFQFGVAPATSWTITIEGTGFTNAQVTYVGQEARAIGSAVYDDCARFDMNCGLSWGTLSIWFAPNVGVIEWDGGTLGFETLTAATVAGVSYPAPVTIPTFGYGPAVRWTTHDPLPTRSACLADMNGDGKLDLVGIVSQGSTAQVGIWLGDGTGAVATQASLKNAGREPTALTVADVNGDGFLDVILATHDAGPTIHDGVSVLLNDGTGKLLPAVNYPGGAGPALVLVADLNGDGALDIVVANAADSDPSVFVDGTVSVFLNDGTGHFLPRRDFPVGKRPAALAIADVNGDGNLDVLTFDATDGTVSILLGDGLGGLAARTTLVVNGGSGNMPPQVAGLAIADLNRDGALDLVVTSGATLTTFLGDGQGGFVRYRDMGLGGGIGPVRVTDVDGDGLLDVVLGNGAVLLGDGFGSFRAFAASPLPTTFDPVFVVSGDLNGDGKLDLLAIDSYELSAQSFLAK